MRLGGRFRFRFVNTHTHTHTPHVHQSNCMRSPAAGVPSTHCPPPQVYDAYLAPAERRIAAASSNAGGAAATATAAAAAGGATAAAGGPPAAAGGKRGTRAVRWEDVLTGDNKRRGQLPDGTVPTLDKVRVRAVAAVWRCSGVAVAAV